MAFTELEPVIADLMSALQHLFAPVIAVDRIGFKEITVRGIATLQALRELFPQAQFVFLFRDPEPQWPSVRSMGWSTTKTLDAFLEEYRRLAEIYMNFGGIFLETTSLYDRARVRRLFETLGLSSFDEKLIGDGVFAMKGKTPLTEHEALQIKGSEASMAYQKMRAIEAAAWNSRG
jgi:hypothetical protein